MIRISLVEGFSVAQPTHTELSTIYVTLGGIILGAAFGAFAAFQPMIALALAIGVFLSLIIIPRPKWGLYIIAGWLPLESLAVFDANFSATKLFTIITFAGWLLGMVKTKSSSIDWREAHIVWLLLFLGAATASLIGAGQFGIGFTQLTTLFMLVAFYFMIIDLVDDEQSLTRVMKIVLTTSLLASLYAVSQFFVGDFGRIRGAYGDPNGSALVLAVLVPLTISFLSNGKTKKLFFWITLLTLLAGIIVTTSRGGIIALLVGLFLISQERLVRKKVRTTIVGLLVALSLTIASLAVFFDNRFTLEGVMATKGAGRFDIWATGLKILPDHWLLGVGLANYKFIYEQYAFFIPSMTPQFRKPFGGHNVFLEIAVEAGIFGLIFLVGFFAAALIKVWRRRNAFEAVGAIDKAIHSSMFAVGIIIILVVFLSLGAMYMKIVWLMLGLAHCQALSSRPRPEHR